MTALLLLIVVPFLAALSTLVTRQNLKALAALPVIVAGLSACGFVLALGASPFELTTEFVAPFTLAFKLDAWRLMLLSFVCFFELVISMYARRSVAGAARPALLVASLLVAFGSACGVILTANVYVLLIFWEVFLLALYGAIASGGEQAERVALKALIIGGASDFLMVMGLMVYLLLGGSPLLGRPVDIAATPDAGLVAFVLIFLGAGAKAGMFPFHTWIPEAAEVMPATGFAALPASLEKILGISFLITVTHDMFALDHRARMFMVVFGLITVFVVLLPALVERNLKKTLALTAISPVGFMVAGAATSQVAAMAGALMYMLTHATYKSGMFLAAGTLEANTGSAQLADLRGLGRAVPALGWGFALAYLAAISMVPTGGFMAKELIFEGTWHSAPWALALLVVGAILNVAVMTKLLATLWDRRDVVRPVLTGCEYVPALLLGIGAFVTGLVFVATAHVFELRLGATEHGELTAMFRHLGPLTLVSLLVWILGIALYLAARERASSPAETFEGLRSSPVTAEALRLANEKKLDWYEVGVKVVEWLTRIVFRYFERLIDVVTDALIAGGKAVSGPALSAVHNGVYGNYLGWVVVGLLAVLALVLM